MKSIVNKIRQHITLSEFFTYKTIAQFSKYLVTGFLASGIDNGLFIILHDIVGKWNIISESNSLLKIWSILSNIAGMLAGFVTSFLINTFWSFKAKDDFSRKFLLTGILFIINLVISSIFIYCASDIFNLFPASMAKVIISGAIVGWNFILFKKVIFKR